MAIILIFKTDNHLVEYPLTNKIIVGRSSSCNLKIEDNLMSGKHGEFSFNNEGKIQFTDLGSRNGSFHNRQSIKNAILKINDQLVMGSTIVSIDEASLTPQEKIQLGVSSIQSIESMNTSSLKRANAFQDNTIGEQTLKNERKSVVLIKNLKNKWSEDQDWKRRNEVTIDQEKSTGKTEFLKLDKEALLKKKK